jgi:hypothetical protein
MADPSQVRADRDDNEAPPPLPSYFGGYALIFVGVIGLALALVLVAKLLR